MSGAKAMLKTRLKAVLTTVGGLVVLSVVIAWLAGAFTAKIAPERLERSASSPDGQRTFEVHEVTKDYLEEAVGTLKAASRTEVSARLLATILEIPVSAGDEVAEDDILVRLDSQEAAARVQQAEQALVAATATRQQAETDFERIRQLFDREVASQSEFDAAAARLNVAQAEETRARRALEEAEVVRSYTTITAPTSGRVVDRLAEPGDTARPGVPLLVIYDAASLRLEAPVAERLAVQLRIGDQLDVHIDALDRTIPAEIDQIVPQADAPSRSFLVKVRLPEDDNLYEGMFGRVRIPAGRRRHLCLAADAVQRVGQLEFVQVVGPDGVIERRMIRTGQPGIPGRLEVLSGLTAGERVILPPQPADDATERTP